MLRDEWPSVREALIAVGVEPDRVEAHLRGRLLHFTARGFYLVGRLCNSDHARLIDELVANFAECRSRNELEACYFSYRDNPRRNPSPFNKWLLQPNHRRLRRAYDLIRGAAEGATSFPVRVRR